MRYNGCKQWLLPSAKEAPVFTNVVAAGISWVTAQTITNPLWIIKTRAQVQRSPMTLSAASGNLSTYSPMYNTIMFRSVDATYIKLSIVAFFSTHVRHPPQIYLLTFLPNPQHTAQLNILKRSGNMMLGAHSTSQVFQPVRGTTTIAAIVVQPQMTPAYDICLISQRSTCGIFRSLVSHDPVALVWAFKSRIRQGKNLDHRDREHDTSRGFCYFKYIANYIVYCHLSAGILPSITLRPNHWNVRQYAENHSIGCYSGAVAGHRCNIYRGYWLCEENNRKGNHSWTIFWYL